MITKTDIKKGKFFEIGKTPSGKSIKIRVFCTFQTQFQQKNQYWVNYQYLVEGKKTEKPLLDRVDVLVANINNFLKS